VKRAHYALLVSALLIVIVVAWATWYWSDGQIEKRRERQLALCLAEVWTSVQLENCLIGRYRWEEVDAFLAANQARREGKVQ
jgi:hypothetical protein